MNRKSFQPRIFFWKVTEVYDDSIIIFKFHLFLGPVTAWRGPSEHWYCKQRKGRVRVANESSTWSLNNDAFNKFIRFYHFFEKMNFSWKIMIFRRHFWGEILLRIWFFRFFENFRKDSVKTVRTIKRIAKFHANSKKESPVFIEF